MPSVISPAIRQHQIEATLCKTKWLLNYATLYEMAIVIFKACDMVLNIHSDASYLSAPQALRRIVGRSFLTGAKDQKHNNGTVMKIAQLIKHSMNSSDKAELGTLFINV